MYIFISIHIVNQYHTKSAVFFLKNQHDYKYYIDFIGLQQFDKQIVNIKRRFRLHIACFALFRQQKNILNTATALFCVFEQHDSVSFLNESIV